MSAGAASGVGGQLCSIMALHARASWRPIAAWVAAVGAMMLLTSVAVGGVYDTQAEIDTYAAAVRDDALVFLNGHVAGIDTLGGIIANEFGFMASFVIPFMAISLVSRMTRREEEQGRTEALLAGGIDRAVPALAAVLVAASATIVVGAALFAGFAVVGVPAGDAVLYAVSMAALGLAFTGIAAVAAQIVEHARGVYGIGLGLIVASYLMRGLGDVQWSPLTWLLPLGWQEQTRAFGDSRWWPVLLPLGLFAMLSALAVAVAARRDLGSALIKPGPGAPEASAALLTPWGLAWRTYRHSQIGWGVAMIVVAGAFGSVAQALASAVQDSPALAEALGGGAAGAGIGVDTTLSLSALVITMITAGYAIQTLGGLREEEAAGLLEARLAGARSRTAWLSWRLAVVGIGVAGLTVLGAVSLALTAQWSLGEGVAGDTAAAVASFLPAVAVYLGLAVLLYAAAPRLLPLAWAAFAIGVLIDFLGDSLNLAGPLLALSPLHVVGRPPVETASAVDLVVLATLALAAIIAGYSVFRRRGIPGT